MSNAKDNVFKLPPQETWLFSVDVYRKPDGTLVARLTDMRSSEIERHNNPRQALISIADRLKDAADGMASEAMMIGDGDA